MAFAFQLHRNLVDGWVFTRNTQLINIFHFNGAYETTHAFNTFIKNILCIQTLNKTVFPK